MLGFEQAFREIRLQKVARKVEGVDMTIHKDAQGRRFVAIEVDVPGTPEAVWEAIATGPGISSWFVPTEVDGQAGGTTTSRFGQGMDSRAAITEWDPPRRFKAESADLGPDAPLIATEWQVESKGSGTCTVRVVHSLFSTRDDWDESLEMWEHGWPGFFRILRLYLAHFAGRPAAAFQVMAAAPEPEAQAWSSFIAALGLEAATGGETIGTREGAPRLVGPVELATSSDHQHALLMRLTAPAPGIAHLFAMAMGDQILLSVRIYLYGDAATDHARREEQAWQSWLAERFAFAGMPT
jgi:uncharacterized protein YndB with AHSA1/START domain